MGAYGNHSSIQVLGKFHAFLRWKGKIYKQLFFITTANASPNLLSRDGCYILGVLKPCYSVETLKRSSTQPTTDLEQHQIHGKSFLHWSDEGTGEEKLPNSTQWSLYMDPLPGTSLKKQDILRVYSVMSTEIRKSPDTASEFQLQSNEEITQHALGQVPTCQETRNLDQLLGNPCAAEPVKDVDVAECVSSFEIVNDKVPADFNTEKVPDKVNTETKNHSPQKKMTGRLDSFLDNFGIVDAVPADLNTGQVPHDWKGPFPGLTRANNNYNFKSPTICQTNAWKKGLGVVLQPNSTLMIRASTRGQKEVAPLQNSTLVMLTSKTSTGSEKTCQNLETGKYPTLKLLGHYISIGWPCDQRQLPHDQNLYWDQHSRPVGDEYPAKSSIAKEFGCPVLRSSINMCHSYSFREF